MNSLTIWTIGYDARTKGEFLRLLREYAIDVLVDVRRFPKSKIGCFSREELESWLPTYGIQYLWLGEELGGFRRGGYRAFTETGQFQEAIRRIIEIARNANICIMCVEKSPRACHRRYIASRLQDLGVRVIHIL